MRKINNSLGRLIIVMLLLTIVIVGGTFAWFTYRSKESALVLSIGDINDSKVIINPYQIRTTMAPVNTYLNGVYSQVQAINNSSNDMEVNLFYRVNQLDDTLINSGLKYTVASSTTLDGEYTEVVTGDFTNIKSNEVSILNTEISAETTLYYRVYIWLDSSAGNQVAVQNTTLDLELNGMISLSPNVPVLDDGMIPVVISNDGTVTTILEDDPDWYDYTKKEWANIVLVTSDSRNTYLSTEDIEVSQEDILAYYVWVPRYKYKIWTTGVSSAGNEQSINIQFESKTDPMTLGTTVGTFRTHPAFWWDVNSDGVVTDYEMLPGIWVAKFETTGTGDNPTVLPNTSSLVSQNVSTQFTTSLKFAGGTQSGSTVSFAGNNTYGLTNDTDSHMMKNSEWGAVAYLSHSGYGINDEVRINNYYNEGTMTGCGALTEDEAESTTCGISYGQASNYPQSTTGNITGIFDMSGGAWEYVMGVLSDSNGNPRSGYSSSYNSGFNGIVYDSGSDTSYTSGVSFPDSKYYDLYLQSQFNGDYSTNMTLCTLDTCGGHALNETANWYSDFAGFVGAENPWFERGGGYRSGTDAGAFYSSYYYGYAYSNYSWRSVLIPVETYEVTYDYRNNIYDQNTNNWNLSGGSFIDNNYSYNGTVGVAVYSDNNLFTGLYIPLNSDKKINTNYKLSLKANKEVSLSGNLRAYSTTVDSSGNLLSYNHGINVNETTLSSINTWKEFNYSFNVGSYSAWNGISIDYDVANQGPVYVSDIRLDEYSTETIVYGDNYRLPSSPTRTGYTFLGWNTEPDGSGETVIDSTLMDSKENHTLYAQWGINTYTITSRYYYYYQNTTWTHFDTKTDTTMHGSLFYPYNVTAPDGYYAGNNYGYYDLASNHLGDGTVGSNYITINQDLVVHVHYYPNTYTISYDANGGSGAPESQSKTHGVDLTLSSTVPTRTGYTFKGWSTSSTATSATYSTGGTYTANSGATLYAVWQGNTYTLSYNGNGGEIASTSYNTAGQHTYTVPYDGQYQIELWGAQGGYSTIYGGYTSGSISLNANEILYFYVGGKGNGANDTGVGGYNGGGATLATSSGKSGPTGGGATDVRLVNGDWNNAISLRSRIMVAGGSSGYYGNAGGLNGYDGQASSYVYYASVGKGATQTSGGVVPTKDSDASSNGTAGSFGQGGTGGASTSTASTGGGAGGGGGYYGGSGASGLANGVFGGGGGSSYISGHAGCIAITSASSSTPKVASYSQLSDSYHYSGKIFTNTLMIDGAGYKWTTVKGSLQQMPNPSGGYYTSGIGHSGNGVAKIKQTIIKKQITYGSAYGTLPTPTREGYKFGGWYTSSTGGIQITSTTSVFTNSNHTIYARWTTLATYTISYNVNGGTGSIASQTKIENTTLTLTNDVPTKSGYKFLGWSTSSTATSATYASGGSYTANASATLYAVWEKSTEIGTYLVNTLKPSGLNTSMEGGLYRFQGTGPNNYICFGTSTKSTCTGNTDAYMYRIIGINSSGQLKLIKNEALNSTTYAWSSSSGATWPNSYVYSGLNGSYYLSNLSSTWSNLIITTTWPYDGLYGSACHLANCSAADMYNLEIGFSTKVTAKIGLMHIHDYYYAYKSGGINCSLTNDAYGRCAEAWIHLSQCDSSAPTSWEWVITRYGSQYGYTTQASGAVSHTGFSNAYSIRPVFYLDASVNFLSGTGTSSDPFIISAS